MLIGCCHCGEPSESIPSESQPSEPSVSESQSESQSFSESQSVSESSQSVSESIPPGPCAACDSTNGYRPSAVQITWDLIEYEPDRYFDVWTDTGGCYSDYIGPFNVYTTNGVPFNTAGTIDGVSLPGSAIECFYGTIEDPLLSLDCSIMGGMTDPTNCRAYLWFVKRGAENYEIYALIAWGNYGYPFTNGLSAGGIWYSATGLVTLNCFSNYNLNFWRMRGINEGSPGSLSFSPGPGYNYQYYDDTPTLTNSFPATISISPL